MILLKRIILTFCFVLIFFSNVYANDVQTFFKDTKGPTFEVIDRGDGLSNLSVSSIIQDRDGFIWFGTQGGLNRYDGRTMNVLRNNPFDESGLLHNLIQTMTYDETKHEIWIGTYQGISRYSIENDTFKNYTVEEGLSNPVVVSILLNDDNSAFVGTMEGLNYISEDSLEIAVYDVPGDVVRDLYRADDGIIYVATYQGLCYFDENKKEVVKIDLDLPSDYVMIIEQYEEGVLTLGLWDGGVIDVSLSNRTLENLRTFSDNRIYAIARTMDDTLWAGSWGGGLFAIDSTDMYYHFTEEGVLPHPIVYSFLEDDTGIMWMGTNGGGVCKINPRKDNYLFLSHEPDNEMSLDLGKINDIYEDNQNRLWIAVYNSGLNRYDLRKKELVKFKKNESVEGTISSDSVQCMLPLDEKTLLLGTLEGLEVLDLETNVFEKWDILSDEIIYALEKEGDNIWIGSYINGLYKYNLESKEIVNYSFKDGTLSDDLIYDILFDKSGRLWVGTNNGLNVLIQGEEKFKQYHRSEGDKTLLASNVIHSIFEDSNGDIWIGMVGGGCAKYVDSQDVFMNFTEESGLSSNVVNGILESVDNRIYVSTTNGISIINPDDFYILNLEESDGLGGWEFNQGTLRSEDGDLYFGGVHGITKIPKDYLVIQKHQPKLYITDVRSFYESVDEKRNFFNSEKLEFGFDDAYIEFDFIAIDYDAPEKIEYLYKLEGFDDKWVSIGNRTSIFFSDLKPGTYNLNVKALTARRIESEIAFVDFTILKPWYSRWYSYLGYFIIFVLLVFLTLKLRDMRMLNRKTSELARLNKELENANTLLEEVSMSDALTGVANRRYMDKILDQFLDLGKRSNLPVGILMLDLDNFKMINDKYGHLAGDHYLVDIANSLKSMLPESGTLVARYGGDEFMVLLYDYDYKTTQVIAEKMLRDIKKIYVRDAYTKAKVGASVSIGLYHLIPTNSMTPNGIIELVDHALYEAKHQGKDRIVRVED